MPWPGVVVSVWPVLHHITERNSLAVCCWLLKRKTLWFWAYLGLNDPVLAFSGGEQTLVDRMLGLVSQHLSYRASIKVNVPANEGRFGSSGTSWYPSAGLGQVCCTFIWHSVFKSVDWYGFVSGSLRCERWWARTEKYGPRTNLATP